MWFFDAEEVQYMDETC